jgi:uncharacterized membrane protein
MARVLLLGESWMIYSAHQKGFDTFYTSEYQESANEFVAALEEAGHVVARIPAHLISQQLPRDAAALREIADVVVVSDVGANTFVLAPETFTRSIASPDRTAVLRDFVRAGGGLLMVGGYLTFSGIDAKGRWGRSALAEALPVRVLDRDDRVELPEGHRPQVVGFHDVVAGLPTEWPALLGLNEVELTAEADLLATCAGYPLVATTEFGDGRTAVFTSDLAPHWAPPEFVGWDGYGRLFDSLVRWLMPAADRT